MRGSRDLDFSFSGLKTALVYAVRDLGPDGATERLADLAASYQRAVVDSLVGKLALALELTGVGALALGGGVAANSQLRRRARELCEQRTCASRFRRPISAPTMRR